MLEKTLWKNVKAMHKTLALGQLSRVEVLGIVGWPDVYSLYEGRTKWIELKCIPSKPKRATTRIVSSGGALDPAQVVWHSRCLEHGGKSFLLVNCWDAGYLVLSNDRIGVYNSLNVNDIHLEPSLREALCSIYLV